MSGLPQPFLRKKSTTYFVNSMNDLFHPTEQLNDLILYETYVINVRYQVSDGLGMKMLKIQ